jgi:hypothetical protein
LLKIIPHQLVEYIVEKTAMSVNSRPSASPTLSFVPEKLRRMDTLKRLRLGAGLIIVSVTSEMERVHRRAL